MSKPLVVLGISAFYHDSAAALLIDGEIIAAAQEERFTRIKHDPAFPLKAISCVLTEAGLQLEDVTEVAFYDKPFLKFERLLETYHAVAPAGIKSFLKAIPVWIKDKLFMKRLIRNELSALGKLFAPILFTEHHLSHAASAFYPSPFEEAAILTVDGVGEWTTTSLGKGTGNTIQILKELHFPHSLGLLYSAFTFYLGFRVNSGEYKMMGLAPYGHPDCEQTLDFINKIKENIIDIRQDGSFLLNMAYFRFASDLQMTDDQKWQALFGIPRRQPETDINQTYMNLALAIQQVTEEIILQLAVTLKLLTGCQKLVMAGGVALNCVANARLVEAKIFDEVWVQPAAGDAGGALGAALAVYYLQNSIKTRALIKPDAMKGAYLGPAYSDKQIAQALRKFDIMAESEESTDKLLEKTAQKVKEGKVIGWFQGRMEFGPRALGNRSILADATHPGMQQRLNEKIKLREAFRPFAPSVRLKNAAKYFKWEGLSPYMLMVAPVNENLRNPEPKNYSSWPLYERLLHPRSTIPAVTHLNYSARLQTVDEATNPLYYHLLSKLEALTGNGVLVNTSFNVRSEPIVCTPEDAIRCFLKTDMDCLAIGNYFISKD